MCTPFDENKVKETVVLSFRPLHQFVPQAAARLGCAHPAIGTPMLSFV
jgi:hypothetical protein